MPYITFYYTPKANRMTFDDLFNNINSPTPPQLNTQSKLTLWRNPEEKLPDYAIKDMTRALDAYWEKYKHLLIPNMQDHYETFYIPKRSGGLRQINAPKTELKEALTELKVLLELKCRALAHNCAYAYVKGRSTLHALQIHQYNESRWFIKLDAKDFFPSCNLNFIMTQLEKSFPFSEICKTHREVLEKCLSLGILNNGLPQGTPLSPTLTNLIMIPIDFKLQHKLRDFEGQNYIYTRYADDFLISCKYQTEYFKVIEAVNEILKEELCPFHINPEKTRYGSSAGRNWNLGLMLNKDNQITVGYRNKQRIKAMLHNYLTDLTNGKTWPTLDVQVLQGLISYYRQIEPEYIDYITQKYAKEFGYISIREAFKQVL